MVRIRDIRVIVTCPGRNYVTVKVLTDEPELYGVGDATLNGRELAVAAALEHHLVPLLIGRDVDRIEDIWQLLSRGGYWRGGPVLMTALAGIDIALWDILGKRADMPVYSLLGGRVRDGVLAYGHASGADRHELHDEVRARTAEGFRVVRVQGTPAGVAATYGVDSTYHLLGEDPGIGDGGPQPVLETGWEPATYLGSVPAMLDALRSEFGDTVEFCHDVHSRLTPQQAARLAREVEPYHLYFLEDPVRPEHADGLRLVRAASTTPLAIGELYTSRFDCIGPITEQLIDFVRCDLAHIGGLSEARRIATIAEPFGVRTAWHGPDDIGPSAHAASVHLGMATPNTGVQEYPGYPQAVLDVMPGTPALRDGYLVPSDAPGLGVDIDEAAAAAHPYRRAYLPTVRRRDGAVHDW